MLVLSRRTGESVVIGDDVVVTVLEVRGDVIRLGIRAPRAVQVHREEVYRELQQANQEAASSVDLAERALSTLLTRGVPAADPRPNQGPRPGPTPRPGPAPGSATPAASTGIRPHRGPPPGRRPGTR